MMTYNTPMSLLSLTEDLFIHILGWWRSWSSTDPARRKGTCDDVQLGSWNTRRTKCHFMSSTILACVKKTSYP
ncbi:BnaCnng47420D [Brassica napus]|uniref:BnaCnng47420D protein n=1 Tax=Brassica napus TaxID=3708 RepID=A0A078JFN7_BRANA|nr:BnaCnng47420D [Brassica napus]